jgi:protein SCO1/2
MIWLRKFLAIGLVIMAFAGGTLFMVLAVQGPRDMPQHATVLPQAAPLSRFTLRDQNGVEFNNESLKGQWNLVFFGFTHCPDICPATLQQLAIARKRVLDAGAGIFPNIILISVDPERDTPEVLAEYTGHFGDGVKGVSGSLDELRKLTSSLGIYFQKSGTQNDNDNYSVDHSAVVILINGNAQFHALFSAPHRVDHFVADIPLIMELT